MTEKWPKVTARRRTRVSPWMAIIEREVEFAPGAKGELYHAVDQRDYGRSLPSCRTGAFQSSGNTGRLWRVSRGSCRRGYSTKAKIRPPAAGAS